MGSPSIQWESCLWAMSEVITDFKAQPSKTTVSNAINRALREVRTRLPPADSISQRKPSDMWEYRTFSNLIESVNVLLQTGDASDATIGALREVNRGADEILSQWGNESMSEDMPIKTRFIKQIMTFRTEKRNETKNAQSAENAQRTRNRKKAERINQIKEIMAKLESTTDPGDVDALFAEISQVAGSKRKVDDAGFDHKTEVKKEQNVEVKKEPVEKL
jgi:hypothetical protein